MDAYRFDTLTKRLSDRVSRRTALRGGSAGLAALAALAGSAAAQEATPVAGATPTAGAATTKTTYLFAQPFDSGTWSANPGEPGTYLLTLKGDVGQTIYFSDRPQRVFGLAPTQKFLDGLGFSPTNPPNAAIIAEAHGDEDQLVIELHDPVYDANTGTLTYHAKVLADYSGAGLAHAALQAQDANFADSFGHGSLFIDDCPDHSGYCYSITNGEKQIVGDFGIPECWDSKSVFECSFCNTDPKSEYYGSRCHDAYPDQCAYSCTGGGCSWDCFAEKS